MRLIVWLAVVLAGSCASAGEKAQPPIELCVRGDDMGHALDINRGFVKAHTEGILHFGQRDGAAPYFDDAVNCCKAHSKLAPGIHVTLMAVVPMRPVLPPDEVPSLVAPDGFFHRGLDDFVKAKPKIEEVEKEIRAQIKKCLDTGLKFAYLDWHMASGGGPQRPDIGDLYPRLAREFRLLYAHDSAGRHTGAKYVAANLETWGSQRLPDGTLAYYSGPDMPAEIRTRFLQTLQNLQPGVWYTVCHPGLYARRQAQSVELICSGEVKEIIRSRNIRLISFQDLWNRKYAGKRP